ncbi:MAG: 2-dehydro-3-deoxyphosphogluconate aldolase, partial [Cyanobacteria bacterium NC_groundwater_1444_Ag_S-0.65um_54_12]|nr:2-dehydro-3-deoxyphosphogluconate aldolase [Cyanobacteria bacterium NC_groundwater_1444_Ag_S-0.65um_54_12]
AGLGAIEVAFTTPGAVVAIAELVSTRRGLVGAGTVLQVEQAKAALAAGASFLVAPVDSGILLEHAHAAGAVAIVGGLTPQEIWNVHALGADFVKVFPVRAMGGPNYLRDLLAPFPDLRLLVSGGVDAANYREYLAAGAQLVALGSTLTPPALVAKQDWQGIIEHVRGTMGVTRDGTPGRVP